MAKSAKDMRHNDFVENMRDIQTIHPEFTWEKAYNDALVLWTMHDYAAFTIMEQEVGTDRAVQLYGKIWELRSQLEWGGLCELIGKRPEDTDFTIHDIANIMIKSFALFGNPMEIVEDTEDRITLRNYDCPYTTQVMWSMLSEKEAEEYNQKIQVECNYAIFETYLKLAGLFDKWLFNFPCQLCMSGKYCEFNFTRIKRPLSSAERIKTYRNKY
ncbi:hypothetical protein KAU37_03370 [Candidatus Bipolaricaulota bacterium]|nr:hypothetical protein [Candidatus Bipolaricaulota bacterium]